MTRLTSGPKSLSMKSIRAEGLRFLIGGVINTGASYVVYLAALLVMSYMAAFCVGFAAGILVAFVVNSRFVFRRRLVWRKFWGVSAIYVGQWLVGLGLLIVWVELARIDERVAPLLNVAVLTPVTFLANRCLLLNRESARETAVK